MSPYDAVRYGFVGSGAVIVLVTLFRIYQHLDRGGPDVKQQVRSSIVTGLFALGVLGAFYWEVFSPDTIDNELGIPVTVVPGWVES